MIYKILILYLVISIPITSIPMSEALRLNNPYSPENVLKKSTASKETVTETTEPPKQQQRQIGLSIGNSCKTMIKNNITSNCPTYDMLQFVFQDNTNPELSGQFITKDGMTQRDTPKLKNSYKYYPQVTSENILWLDPPNDVQDHLNALIIIEPSIQIYKTHDSYSMDDYTIKFGKDRWVDESCRVARITASDWVFLTGDTTNYILNKCDPNFTRFDHTFTLEQEKSYQDFSSSYMYKLYQWIDEIKENCKTKGCNITQQPQR